MPSLISLPLFGAKSWVALCLASLIILSGSGIVGSNIFGPSAAFAAGDTTKPKVVFDQPVKNVILDPGIVKVKGRAYDNVGGSGIRIVEIRIDGGIYKQATPSATTGWSDWSSSFSVTSPGTHTIQSRVIDKAGNRGWESVKISILAPSPPDTTGPAVAIISPGNNSIVQVASGDPLTIKGTASSAGSGVRVVEVRVDDGYYKVATPIAAGDWSSWTVDMPITAGQHRLVPRVTDNEGKQAWNSIYVTVTESTPVPPPPPTGGDLDPFGIAKLYPTAAGDGNEYYTKTNAATVTEFRDNGRVDRLPSTFSKNADGSWHIPSGTTPRWVINGGWRNVEMTMQLKINSGSLVQLYSNGEQHTTSLDGAWHGSANKMRVYADGRMGFIKELYHESGNSGYTSETATRNSGTAITGKWVTVKFVGYTVDSQRKLEAYVSVNNDNKFIKVAEYTDNGNWYASTRFDAFIANLKANYPSYVPENRDTGQEIKRNEVITWEGDWVSFRSDGADYDFRNVSVREINAGAGANLTFVASTTSMPAPLEQAYVEPAHHDE